MWVAIILLVVIVAAGIWAFTRYSADRASAGTVFAALDGSRNIKQIIIWKKFNPENM